MTFIAIRIYYYGDDTRNGVTCGCVQKTNNINDITILKSAVIGAGKQTNHPHGTCC